MSRRIAVSLFIVSLVAVSSSWAALPAGAKAPGSRAARRLPAPVRCVGCWKPALRVSWQWQLMRPPKASELLDVRMYDIDGFDTPRGLIQTLHRRGSKAVCYLSAGSRERWRPDAGRFPPSVVGRPLDGWPGEKWLDVRRLDVLGPIMRARIGRCARKGFDGVEFDNVDAYQQRTGFPLSAADQLRYNVFLANRAHRRGLTAFLKNDIGQAARLLPYFDAALNEECHHYKECSYLNRFVAAGKPAFGVEYDIPTTAFCPSSNRHDFNFLKKRLALGAWRVPCRGV
jgi:hypothetical protein